MFSYGQAKIDSMKKKLNIVLIALLMTFTQPLALRAEPLFKLQSKWKTYPVYIDGDITLSNEWIDAESVELTIGSNYGRSPPYLDVSV